MAEITERRHVKTHVSLRLLSALLDVPEDVRVVRLIPSQDPDGIELVLESDRFEPVNENAESPYVHGLQTVVATDDDTGAQFFRLKLDI
ncbi:hypothetical protein [Aeromicrobium sp. UC242_57]|uniref:hypothetical protein n=1 Tax=Aeromicrobium sp. UC242_57 TaxID=3374624 RepID=UPI0037A88478